MSLADDTSLSEEMRGAWTAANEFSRVLGAYREQLEDVGFTRDEAVDLCKDAQRSIISALGASMTQPQPDAMPDSTFDEIIERMQRVDPVPRSR